MAHGPIPAYCLFCKSSFVGMQPHPFIYICLGLISSSALTSELNSYVRSLSACKPKIFTIWPAQKKLANPWYSWKHNELRVTVEILNRDTLAKCSLKQVRSWFIAASFSGLTLWEPLHLCTPCSFGLSCVITHISQ